MRSSFWPERNDPLVKKHLDTRQPIRSDVGDAQHIGRTGCTQWYAGRDDDAITWIAELFLVGDVTGAIDHVVEVAGIFR